MPDSLQALERDANLVNTANVSGVVNLNVNGLTANPMERGVSTNQIYIGNVTYALSADALSADDACAAKSADDACAANVYSYACCQ